MSKENKVNPGQYTQAGRLTPDDTAREMKKQRPPSHAERPDATARQAKPQSFQDRQPKATAEPRAVDADQDEEEAKDDETR